jgi:alkyl sulfatase BDS1-like metallo-beta-lactamase superfamily hydrolase
LAFGPGVWSIVGVTGVNHQVIDAPEGLIVVDTGSNDGVGAAAHALLRTITDRPIAALVYTHAHFCFGTLGVLGDQDPASIRIHAHADCHANVTRITSHEAPGLFYWRLAQAGVPLPDEGPDADPIGLDSGVAGRKSYLPPTDLWAENGAWGEIAGERVQVFTAYPFDSPDTLILWFPDRDVVVHGHMSLNFPNVASNGGGRFRDPQPWLDGLDVIARLDPEHLLGVHGPPVSGRATVRRVIRDQRDALQFIYDQCVRGINRGMSAEDVLDTLILPRPLAESPELHGDYAPWDYHIKAIYAGLMNWYWGDAVDLIHVPQHFESEQLVAGFGGIDAMLATVRDELAQRHYAWAAKLARHCVRAFPERAEGRTLLAQALRAMGQASAALTTRNICLTQAEEWEGRCDRRTFTPGIDPQVALLSPPGTWVRALGFRLKVQQEPDPPLTLRVRFTGDDGMFTCGLCLRRSVAAYLPPEDVDAETRVEFSATLNRRDWLRWFFGEVTWDDLMAAGEVTTAQASEAWARLWVRFDSWPPYRDVRECGCVS